MVWENYPANYREKEIQVILRAVRSGECVSVIGLSGSGKSNLMGFLANRVEPPPHFLFLDCNRMLDISPTGFWKFIARQMGETELALEALEAVDLRLEKWFSDHDSLCWVVDRFDRLPGELQMQLAGQLRAFRDQYKYQLTYVIAGRCALDAESEIAELFFANTLWLGPLTSENARWSMAAYASRRQGSLDESTMQAIAAVSGRYPAFLRACCEAVMDGCAPEVEALRQHPAVARRLKEFWSDRPTPDALKNSGLEDVPLLSEMTEAEPAPPDDSRLTASEARLLKVLQAQPGKVIEKDALIQQVWPEERAVDGLRDDSLAQLVRRLRKKVGEERIETIPGRGYRWRG
ncbi:MAG TPA: winged helix-turn-helix domain-containing protein [Anaerolineaceae bacterium]|nr:winged helix-turn-helix domain-containing protein [Anaerolineaceae bacterium]HPN53603.1 winged helix-turn-helix domain-containing protein [Anaerolineaceae bacterium]